MKQGINIYKDGAIVRLHNKRISFIVTDEMTKISFQFADGLNSNSPACLHTCHKGKIRDTYIQMSVEAMENLVVAYINYKENFDRRRAITYRNQNMK